MMACLLQDEMTRLARCVISRRRNHAVASLIGRLGSSTFRLSTAAVSMSLAGSCFSSESAPRPFHHGIRGRGGTIWLLRDFGAVQHGQRVATSSDDPAL